MASVPSCDMFCADMHPNPFDDLCFRFASLLLFTPVDISDPTRPLFCASPCQCVCHDVRSCLAQQACPSRLWSRLAPLSLAPLPRTDNKYLPVIFSTKMASVLWNVVLCQMVCNCWKISSSATRSLPMPVQPLLSHCRAIQKLQLARCWIGSLSAMDRTDVIVKRRVG